ncbi:MAG: hypothetical protein L6R42_009674, partial [Xanthoria sp. 1 TBL-2021]
RYLPSYPLKDPKQYCNKPTNSLNPSKTTRQHLKKSCSQSSLGDWSLGKALELAKAKALELDLPQVALDIETWVKAHPWKAAFYLASAIGFFAPEILSLPALEALGFGVAGVRAGMLKLSVFALKARVLIEIVDV